MRIKNLGTTWRRSAAVAVTGVGIAATVVFGAGVAQAFTPYQQAWTGTNQCLANLYIEPGTSVGQTNTNDYAQAEVYQSSLDSHSTDCAGWLERSTDGGSTWQQLGSTHWTSGPGTSDATGWYYDGPGYMARACAEDETTFVHTCTTGY